MSCVGDKLAELGGSVGSVDGPPVRVLWATHHQATASNVIMGKDWVCRDRSLLRELCKVSSSWRFGR
jgi:hypothetical protein